MGLFGKKFKTRCLLCKQEFKDEDEYKIHIETLHPLEKPCKNCKGIMNVHPKDNDREIKVATGLTGWSHGANFYFCETCGYMELFMKRATWY